MLDPETMQRIRATKHAVIPAKSEFTASGLREYFGIYPQLRNSWRVVGFPSANENGIYPAPAIISWLRARGWQILVT